MQFKSLKLFPIVLLLVLMELLVIGCGKQGSRFPNIAPTIAISSYEGYDPSIAYTDSSVISFQQKIYWHGDDKDGIVTGYAYRILDKFGNPMSTAGNLYIDSTGTYTPQSVLDKFHGAGWVLHYKPGADQDIPMDSLAAKKTIWTTNKFAVVNFIAANSSGDPETTINSFEVICIDNRGLVSENSAVRIFRSESKRPVCFLSTTKGDPDSTGTSQVGTGIRLSFNLNDSDEFLQPTAWYYQFKVQKFRLSDDVLVSEKPANEWANTLRSTKINEYLLTKYTRFRTTSGDSVDLNITTDYDNSDNQVSYTVITARVVDLAGVTSLPTSIKFIVKEGFHPRTIIYSERVYAVGDYQSIEYLDPDALEVMPFVYSNNQALYATQFFVNNEGDNTAVYSPNLKIWVRWGWHGEYGKISDSGNESVTDYPFDRKLDKLYDDVHSDVNYYSEITNFDIRLDGEPYHYPPYANSIVKDPGTNIEWLRVPVNSSLGQTIVLTNLSVNTPENPYHIFEVRAVDLQNEVDPTPAVLKFKIVEPVLKAQKQNILVIDDDIHSTAASPSAVVDSLWNSYFNNTGYTPTVYHYATMNIDDKIRRLAISDLQNYKLIFYHSENPTSITNIFRENDGLALYLKQGGNFVVSITGNGAQYINTLLRVDPFTMPSYFGLIPFTDQAKYFHNTAKFFFVKALGQNSGNITYNDVNVNFQGFSNLINSRKGFYSAAYFPEYDTETKLIYKFGCKPVDSTFFPPTQEEFDTYNNLPIGIKKITSNNKCYILGFPLSYMVPGEAAEMVHKIVDEAMAN